MKLDTFDDMILEAKKLGPLRVAVAAAADPSTLEGVRLARREGLIEPILVGDQGKISEWADKVELNLSDIQVVHEVRPDLASHKAVDLVAAGEAQVLMKGLVNTVDFLRAVLRPERGLRTGRRLSHLSGLQVPTRKKILWVTDAAMNIAPDLEQKQELLENAIDFLHRLCIDPVKVVALAANEIPSPKMPSSTDAQRLAELNREGRFSGAIVEGPLALDGALSSWALAHKGIASTIDGDPDLLLVPAIDAGNILIKSVVHLAGGLLAGIVLGAQVPIVLTSRSDPPQSKLVSIAAAILSLELSCGDKNNKTKN